MIIDLRNGLCLSIITFAIISSDEELISSRTFFNLLFSASKKFTLYFSDFIFSNSSFFKL